MDHNKQGLALLDKNDAAGALLAFTRALIEHPTSPDYYSNRSKAFARLSPPRHSLSLQDAETAVVTAYERGKRDKIREGQLRRVVALYNLGQYAAVKALIDAIKVDEKEALFNIWKIKTTQKLAAQSDGEAVHVVVDEKPKLDLPDLETLRLLLKKQIKGDGTFDFEAAEAQTDAVEAKKIIEEVKAAEKEQKLNVPIVVRQDWFQTSSTVTITLFAKGVDKDKFEADIKEDSLYLSFPNPGNTESEYSFSVDPSYGAIDKSKSKATVLKTKVEIVLQKAVPGQKWSALEGTERPVSKDITTTSAAPSTVPMKETAPSYPTSSRTGAKNWDKVAADLTAKKPKKPKKKDTSSESEPEDEGVGSDIEGGDDVDNFFKKLYKDSDPDTQRAMMKSYYESGGTSLSTNWSEVGSKRVEPYKSEDD